MEFGEVLSRAWQVIWKHKVLWIFGILAGCSNANGSNASLRNLFQQRTPPRTPQFFNQFNNIPNWQIALIIGAIVLVILILVILAIFLGTVGRVGLIRGTLQAEQEATQVIFGELFSGSLPYFWRVFGLNLIVGLAAFFLVLILIVPFTLFAILTLGIGLLCIIPLICLAVPFFWLVGLVIEQANIAIVTEDVGIMDGLRLGWNVFRDNFGAVFVMGLILSLGINLIGGFIISIPLAIVAAPAIISLASGTQPAFGRGLLVAALCFVAYLPVLVILGGALRAYIESAWTLTYLRLTGKPRAVEPVPSAA
ncbi:MAG TPA: hypothetical protein VE136_15485 [Anaerolineales bacterium]|nr:hypothetical protein [Anaerolineales bacterium]